ncbi:MAG: STAS domain-containing protein [Candidatus Brocadiaceae bacterium]|nr:STAS domain-containing protein [Candidatus Brocadiaceae bacterium]
MEIEIREKEKSVIVVPKGDLLFEGIDTLEMSLRRLREDGRCIMLDLSHTKYVSAKALGVMVSSVQSFKDKQKRLKFFNVNEYMKKFFDRIGIFKLIEIFDSEKDAIESLAPNVGIHEKELLWSKEKFIS